jgi:hypothetical protein
VKKRRENKNEGAHIRKDYTKKPDPSVQQMVQYNIALHLCLEIPRLFKDIKHYLKCY